MKTKADVLLEDLCFAESPRWRDGVLWFSDMQDFCVRTVDLNGKSEVKLRTPCEPSGLGWLPDGRMLVVSMMDQKVLRVEAGGVVQHADLSAHTRSEVNDMITLPNGRSYVGNFGYDIRGGEPLTPTVLVRVEADGSTAVAASDMLFPNGMVAYGDTLVVAETRGPYLTAFDMADDGTLSNRRIWAQLDTKTMPDGIALDREGAIWVCSPRGDETFRVLEGGRVTHRVKVSGYAIACALGGPEGRDLLICSTKTLTVPECRAKRLSCIEHVKVDVPGGAP
jgi:sugar lactone lactonase YvrE